MYVQLSSGLELGKINTNHGVKTGACYRVPKGPAAVAPIRSALHAGIVTPPP